MFFHTTIVVVPSYICRKNPVSGPANRFDFWHAGVLDSRPDDPSKPLCNVQEARHRIVFEEQSPEHQQHDLR